MARDYLKLKMKMPDITVYDEDGWDIEHLRHSIQDVCSDEEIWQLLVQEVREDPKVGIWDLKFHYITILRKRGFDPSRGRGLFKASLMSLAGSVIGGRTFYRDLDNIVPKVADCAFLQAAIAYSIVVDYEDRLDRFLKAIDDEDTESYGGDEEEEEEEEEEEGEEGGDEVADGEEVSQEEGEGEPHATGFFRNKGGFPPFPPSFS